LVAQATITAQTKAPKTLELKMTVPDEIKLDDNTLGDEITGSPPG